MTKECEKGRRLVRPLSSSRRKQAGEVVGRHYSPRTEAASLGKQDLLLDLISVNEWNQQSILLAVAGGGRTGRVVTPYDFPRLMRVGDSLL